MSQAGAQIFQVNREEARSFKDRLKLTMSGISGAFMLPISTLAIVAIFLSVGSYLEGVSSIFFLKQFGNSIKSIAFPLLQTIPLLFCVGFTVSFCKGDLTCVWGAIIAYMVFVSVQSAFIFPDTSTKGYTVLFSWLGRSPSSMKYLVDRNMGIVSLNTSIFGSFLLGAVVMPHIHKRWFNVQLPGPLTFFSGKRFVPVAAGLYGFALALLFLFFWPWIGMLLSISGKYISKIPYGIDSFVFGFLEKSLIPFGLHHMFYAPLWFSSLGGDVIGSLQETVKCVTDSQLDLTTSTTCSTSTVPSVSSATSVLASLFSGANMSHSMWQGDSFIGASLISLPSNEISFKNSTASTASTAKVMDFVQDHLGINVGRFTQGKYPVMQFGLPAAGLAMLMSAPEKNRKEASKVIFPAILSSFFMGITESIEFLFLFAAPQLFYGFHAVLCGISFLLMNVLGAHIPSIFSGGIIELFILGVIPVSKGTQFWWYIIVGLILAPIYFAGFSFAIKFWNIATPGRDVKEVNVGSEIGLKESKVPEQTRKLAIALGGWDNIEKMANCASRLRYDIYDKSKVDEQGLKAAGIIACKWIGENHLQAIVGPKAEFINQEMIKWSGEDLGI